MTTRRRRPPAPPPPRGRRGRFGLLPPLAIAHTKVLSLRGDGFAGAACSISVKAPQLRPDADLLPQDTREHATVRRSFEARKAAARVGATPGLVTADHERALAGREADQLALRCAPTAACAAPLRFRAYEGSSSAVGSTGIPAGTSSDSATSAPCSSGRASSASPATLPADGATGGSSPSAGGSSATGSVSLTASSPSTGSASVSSASEGGAPAAEAP